MGNVGKGKEERERRGGMIEVIALVKEGEATAKGETVSFLFFSFFCFLFSFFPFFSFFFISFFFHSILSFLAHPLRMPALGIPGLAV